MRFIIKLLSVFVFIKLFSYCAADVKNLKKYDIGEGETLYLQSHSIESLRKCVLTNPSKKLISLKTDSEDRIQYFGNGLTNGDCGAKISNIQSNDEGNWTIELKTHSNNINKYLSTLTVEKMVESKNFTIKTEIGASVRIECGPNNAKKCTLYSPLNEIISSNSFECNNVVRIISPVLHEGVWTCKYFVKGFMLEQSDKVTLKIIPFKNYQIGYNKTDDSINIFCNPSTNYISFCKLTMPNGIELFPSLGLGDGRYRFYGYNYGHCGITFKKPLLPEENGIWLCQAHVSGRNINNQVFGDYIAVGNITGKIQISAIGKTVFSKIDSIQLDCHINAHIEYCYYRSPNGTIYNIPPSTIQDYYSWIFGYCSLKVPSNNYNFGIWSCHIGIKEDSKEYQEDIKVIESNGHAYVTDKIITVEKSESATLGCKTIDNITMTNCHFIRPDGLGISSNLIEDKFYTYTGKGLNLGDCELTLRSVRSVDYGVWTCIFGIISANSFITLKVELKEPEGLSLTTTLSIALGCLILFVGCGYIITVIIIIPKCRVPISDDMIPISEESIYDNVSIRQSSQNLRQRHQEIRRTSSDNISWF